MHIEYFHKQEELGQNPYIGFLSFQHFREEELYSDVVVRPEKGMTETENYECYPVPANLVQSGREEAFILIRQLLILESYGRNLSQSRGNIIMK